MRSAIEARPPDLTLEDRLREQTLLYASNSFVDRALTLRTRACDHKYGQDGTLSDTMSLKAEHDIWTPTGNIGEVGHPLVDCPHWLA
jgi:hypothetical protein